MDNNEKTNLVRDLQEEWYQFTCKDRPYPPGRNDLPEIFVKGYRSGLFEGRPELLALALTDAWTSADNPGYQDRELCFEAWGDFFLDAGFIHDGIISTPPTHIPTLYRGSAKAPNGRDGHFKGFEAGYSWTDDIACAMRFWHITKYRFGLEPVLNRITQAEPAMVLARFEAERNEAEWVLNRHYSIDLMERIDPTPFLHLGI